MGTADPRAVGRRLVRRRLVTPCHGPQLLVLQQPLVGRMLGATELVVPGALWAHVTLGKASPPVLYKRAVVA